MIMMVKMTMMIMMMRMVKIIMMLMMDDDEGNVFSIRGLLEILQLDLLLQDEVLQPQTHSVSWHLELMGETKDGVMKIYSVQRDFVGLAPLVMVKSTSINKSLTSVLSSSPNPISQSPFPPHPAVLSVHLIIPVVWVSQVPDLPVHPFHTVLPIF